jgi:outer membrane protein
LVPTF